MSKESKTSLVTTARVSLSLEAARQVSSDWSCSSSSQQVTPAVSVKMSSVAKHRHTYSIALTQGPRSELRDT